MSGCTVDVLKRHSNEKCFCRGAAICYLTLNSLRDGASRMIIFSHGAMRLSGLSTCNAERISNTSFTSGPCKLALMLVASEPNAT